MLVPHPTLDAYRVPDRLQLEEVGDVPRALVVRLAAHDALDVLGGEALQLLACPSAPARSIAFTSMCPASHGASSSRCPVRRLTTPPGTSDVASTSASSTAASGEVSEATTTVAFPPTMAGAIRETSPASGRLLGSENPDDSGRLRHGEVEVRPGDGIRRAEHLRAACRPSPRTRRADRSSGRPPPARSRGRRTRPGAPRASRRSGRRPGRGCKRSSPTSRRPPLGLPEPRRGDPSARRARRSRPAPRRCGPTPSAGTRRRCTACTSS